MSKTYIGLAMSSTMFQGDCGISRKVITPEEVKEMVSSEIVSCFNPSHVATIEALQGKFGISVPIPEVAPKVTLELGDSLVVLSARFSRRLSEGEKFSPEEVDSAKFEFVEYHVHREWRPCQCGSGVEWSQCCENSNCCG